MRGGQIHHVDVVAHSGTVDGVVIVAVDLRRLVAPEATLENVRPWLPAMGITRVANVTGLDDVGIPVVMVCRPNSRSISVSQGKGQDLMAAKASGIMESIESYHAERIALPLKLGCLEDLRYTHDMIDVDQLPRLSDSAFTPFAQALWIEGRDLMRDRQLWLPYEMVHLNYSLPLPTGHGCFVANSNGLTSGNHRLEAICHGICEVVERDAITLWHLLADAEQQATRLDLKTIEDLICRGNEPVPVPPGVVEGIRGREDDNGLVLLARQSPFKKGDPVRVITGALIDQIGIFDCETSSRGAIRWATCQSSEYFSPIRARSGPVLFEPQSIGWSNMDSAAML